MIEHDHGLSPGHSGRGSYNPNGDSRTSRSLARHSHQVLPQFKGGRSPEPLPMPMPSFNEEEKRRFTIGDYVGLIWRGKLIILGCVIVASVASAYWTYSLPFVYQSALQVLINERDKSADVFASRTDIGWTPPERVLKKELQILTSQPVRESSAEQLIQRRFLDSAKHDSVIPIIAAVEVAFSAKLKKLPPEGRQKFLVNEVAARLLNVVFFNPSKEADVIKIVTRTGDPKEAALITNIYAKAYQEDNQQQNRQSARKLKDFIADRMTSTRDTLSQKEEKLSAYREANGILGIAGQTTDLLTSSSKFAEEAVATRIQISSLTRKIAEERRQLRMMDSSLPEQMTAAFPTSIGQLITLKASLDTKRKLFLASQSAYASEQWRNAEIAKLDREITNLEGRIREETERYKNSMAGIASRGEGVSTAALQGLRGKIIDDEIELAAERAKLSELNSALGEVKGKMSQVPGQEMAMERLERDKKTLEELYGVLNEKYYSSVLEEQSVFSNVRILETALPIFQPISPNRTSDIITGCVVGLGLGAGLVLLIAFIDTTIHTPDDLEKNGFTMLAAIPTIREDMLEGTAASEITPTGRVSPHLITQVDPKSPIAESYRSLRTSLQFAAIDDTTSVILFTSSTPQEGKSTTSVNTSIVFAQTGARTLLIDCDLRRPILHSVFGLTKEPGLVNCLVGKVALDEAIHHTSIPNLDILTSGSIPPNPSELLGSRRMRDLVEELRERYDNIIIDSPPTSAVTDAAILSTLTDLSVLVVRAHKTKVEYVEKTREEFQRVFVTPLGVVLNDFDVSQSYGSAYKYYRYYKYYGYYGQSTEARNRKQRRAMAALRSFTG